MWWLERRFVPAEDVGQGPLPARFLTLAWLLASAAFGLAALPALPDTWPSLAAVLGLALVLARLTAVDLAHLLLPDVYTLPLLVAGLLVPPLLGWQGPSAGVLGAVVGGGVALGLAVGLAVARGGAAELGGGDIKLMAALGAWVGLFQLPLALAVACFLSLGLAFAQPRGAHIPFGPGLCIGLFATLLYPNVLEGLLGSVARLIP